MIRVSYGPFQLNELEEEGVEEVKASILRDQLGLPRDKNAEEKEAQTLTAKKPNRRPMRKPSEKGKQNADHQRKKTRHRS